MLDKDLLSILVCPKCKTPVREQAATAAEQAAHAVPASGPGEEPRTLDGWLVCTSAQCGLRYPVRGGIPIMLIDEAVSA